MCKKVSHIIRMALTLKLHHFSGFKLSIVAYLGETLNEDVKAIVELKNLDDRIKSTDGLIRQIILPSGNFFQTLDYTFTST